MTQRQEILWREFRLRKTPAVLNELVVSYQYLVDMVVRQMRAGRSSSFTVIDMDDLKQAADIGLLEALERFDWSKGVKFETYAANRIKGAIQDELRKVDWVPRSVRKKVRQTEKMQDQLRNLSPADLSSTATEQGSYVPRMEKPQLGRIEPMDFSENQLSQVDPQFLTEEMNPQEEIEHEEVRQQLIKSIEKLEKRERLVITLYYFEELTLKEIAQILRISESRVSQIHQAVLTRLRSCVVEYT